MKIKGLFSILVILTITLSCGSQPDTLPSPGLPAPTASSTSLPTLTLTSTTQPTLTPTVSPTLANTSLPPLPDFAEVISFGLGGGGGPCEGADRTPNSITLYGADQSVYTCLWLKGIDIDQPFVVYLSQPDNPNGDRFESPNLFFDSSNGTIRWEGYQGGKFFMFWDHNNGILNVDSLGVRTAVRLSPGRWRFSIVQKGSAFGEVWSDFQVSDREGYPYISVVTRPKNELTPGAFPEALVPKENGGLDVLGEDFPPNTPIYILLYRSIPGTLDDMQLVRKQVVVSDRLGSIITELSGPFDFGHVYLATGISDPSIPVTTPVTTKDSSWFKINHPYDRFKLVSPDVRPSASSSCPDAPQQRMIVNQHGYVCTQSRSVRLRQGPSGSAEVLIELPTESQFTVTGGPSCADNWSWWQVQTEDGETGWIAEGGDQTDPYFICPLP